MKTVQTGEQGQGEHMGTDVFDAPEALSDAKQDFRQLDVNPSTPTTLLFLLHSKPLCEAKFIKSEENRTNT